MRGAVAWIAVLLAGAPLRAQQPRIVQGARIDSTQSINFASGVWPSSVYVGQQATYEIGIFLDEEVRARLRRNPEFIPPDVRSMLAVDLPVARQLYTRRAGGRQYDVHVFSRAMFPLQAGRQVIGSARLNYAVPLSSSIFSREESHTARATEHTIDVREPPAEGRPSEYRGAVGRLALASRVDVTRTRVGVPVTLTVTVSGVGSMPLLPRPTLEIPWAQVVNGPERLNIDSSSTLIGGTKHFDFVVTPKEDGTRDVPELRYTFFNPYTEKYEVAVAPSLPLRVDPGTVVASTTSPDQKPQRLTLRRAYRGETPAPWATLPSFWFGALIAPIPALVLASRRRRRTRPDAADARLRVAAADPLVAPSVVRQAFVHAVTDRLNSVQLSIVDPKQFEKELRREGVSRGVAQEASRFLQALNEACFSPRPDRSPDLGPRALQLHQAIDAEAIQRRGPRVPSRRHTGLARRSFPGGAVLLLLAGIAAATATAQLESRASRFLEGIERYEHDDLRGAQEIFRNLAQLEPRAADTWANLGTVSWELGDSVDAAAGWHRALRLEPLAADARERLSGTSGFTNGLFGDVPPLPPNPGALVALIAWIAACGAFGIFLLRGARIWREGAMGAFAVAAGVGLLTLMSAERARGANRSLLTQSLSIHELPALASPTSSQGVTGEQVRVIAHEGGWDRVAFSDGREGWVEGHLLLSLEVPASR